MTAYLGVRNQGSTWRIPFDTAAADGGAEGFSATIEAADFDIYKDGSATQRSSTSGFSVDEDFDGVTGAHRFSADLDDDADAGFYAGGAWLECLFSPDETVDGQTLVKWIGCCDLEPDWQAHQRKLPQYLGGGPLGASGSHSTSVIDMTGVLDADTQADAVKGVVFAVRQASGDDRPEFVVATALTATTLLMSIELLGTSGGTLSFTPAAGDQVWPVGVVDRAYLDKQRSIPAKNSAFSFDFKMVDETDFVTGEAGLTVTAEVSQDGGAFGAAAGTVTEIGSGWYEFAAAAGDMNMNKGIFRFTATGAAPTEVPIITDGGV